MAKSFVYGFIFACISLGYKIKLRVHFLFGIYVDASYSSALRRLSKQGPIQLG